MHAKARSLLHNARLDRLFVVVGGLFLLTVAIFFHLLNSEKNIAIHFAEKEIEGGLYLRPLRQAVEHLHRHHTLARSQSFGGTAVHEGLSMEARKVTEALEELKMIDARLGEDFKTENKIKELEKKWSALRETQGPLGVEEADEHRLELMSDLQKLISLIGDTSNLILDPDLDSYYMMDAILLKLPNAMELLIKLEALLEKTGSQGAFSLDKKVHAIAVLGNLESGTSALNTGLRTGFRNNPSGNLRPALEEPLGRYTTAMESLVKAFDGILSEDENALARLKNSGALAETVLEENFKLWDRTIEELDQLLRTRIGTFNERKRYALVTVVLMTMLTLLFGTLIFRVIALQKKSEAELKSSEERFRAISEASPLGVYMTDAQGLCAYINRVYQTISGLTPEEAAGDGWGKSIHPDDRDRVVSQWYEYVKNPVLFESEHRFLRKDGSVVWTNVKSAPIREQKAILGYVGTVEDITLRKQLEEQLLQSQKMETVGSLAGGVAHDLNNHLSPLMGYLDLILKEMAPDDLNYPLLQEAGQAARRSAEVVQRLLNFSRKSSQKKAKVRIDKLLDELRGLLHNFLPSTIRTKITVNGPLHPVLGNETELQTILMNLAANSRDAMPDGGSFTVSAQNIHLEASVVKQGHPAGDYILIRTSDTGQGIPAEIMRRIFEPFFTTKTKGRGTGLGLSMVFSIIKDHLGWVEVSSEVGRGTEFSVYLPASQTNAGADTASDPIHDKGLPRGKEMVLLVDDEEPLRLMGKTFLDRLGYQVLLAADGEEAARIYADRAQEIEVILMDMTMPKLTGKETLHRLLRINPKARIILISGYTAEGTIQELLDEGASGYIAKPYNISLLATTIRTAIDRQ